MHVTCPNIKLTNCDWQLFFHALSGIFTFSIVDRFSNDFSDNMYDFICDWFSGY